ncbi:MAG: alpha/beta fold hydrolase [Xanthomonadales bacterium]|nr:alpha/beta fold hydrolase [Xanthomonadales bacterium]
MTVSTSMTARLAPPPLHCRSFGDPAAEPVLLVHGMGSTGADWAFQIEPLAARFRVLVPDLPGAGASPMPARHAIADYAAQLIALLDALAIERTHCVGFSMGGAVGLELALQAPARVLRLATINSLPSYRPDTLRKRLELHGQLNLVRLLGLRRSAVLVARRLFPHPHQQAMRERVQVVLAAYPKPVYLGQAHALAGWCARARLSGFATPMLMLAAEHDYTPLAEKQAWAQRLGAELRVVRGSRHGTPFDAITATNSALLHFLLGDAVPEQLALDAPEHAPTAPPEVLAALESVSAPRCGPGVLQDT